jgi:RES domain-containing protein
LILAWRIIKQKHAKTAFTGEGARLYGGRWNSPSRPMVYTSESRALALAEILVHLESSGPISRYVTIRVEIDETFVANIPSGDLPKNWRADPAPKRLQIIGDGWLVSQVSAVLRVPSAVVVGESNYLLNPSHPDFPRLKIKGSEKFLVDRRLIK